MFSFSQTSRGFFCLEWSSTEDGPKIVHLQHVKIPNDLSDKNILKNIVDNFDSNLKTQSDSLSVIFDNESVLFSLVKIDLESNNEKLINWYEAKVMDDSFNSMYYNCYFPMDSNNNCLLVSIPKKIQDNIINSSKIMGFNLVYLSVDIFSASVLASRLYQKETQNEYLIWKINNNNNHMLVSYNKDKIKLFLKLKVHSNNITVDFVLGPNNELEKVKSFINNILINKKIDESFENVFIYQTKDNLSLLRKILDKKYTNIRLLDLYSLVENKTYDKFKCIPYVENGICFKGLDL